MLLRIQTGESAVIATVLTYEETNVSRQWTLTPNDEDGINNSLHWESKLGWFLTWNGEKIYDVESIEQVNSFPAPQF